MDVFHSCIGKLIISSLMNVSLGLNFLVVRKPVHFMDEYFEVNIWINFERTAYGCMQPIQGFLVFVLYQS